MLDIIKEHKFHSSQEGLGRDPLTVGNYLIILQPFLHLHPNFQVLNPLQKGWKGLYYVSRSNKMRVLPKLKDKCLVFG